MSTWFRDYLYIPLGGSRVGKWKAVRNTFVIFLVSGFWHGANWTFIVWGLLHALLFLPLLLAGSNRKYVGDLHTVPTIRELCGMLATFTSVTVAWVFFRSENLSYAFSFLHATVSGPPVLDKTLGTVDFLFLSSAVLLGGIAEILSNTDKRKILWHPLTFGFWALLIILFRQHNQSEAFIYFQF